MFFSTINKVSFVTEAPSMASAINYGKYAVLYLYASIETSEYSNVNIKAVFGFDALKNPEEALKYK